MIKASFQSPETIKILLSIKPEFTRLIFSGEKTWEFRKKFLKVVNPIYVIMYETSPTQKIVGGFKVGKIINLPLQDLWSQCCVGAGISRHQFFQYFCNHETGLGIEITDLVKFQEPIDPFIRTPLFYPPQNYSYLQEELYGFLITEGQKRV